MNPLGSLSGVELLLAETRSTSQWWPGRLVEEGEIESVDQVLAGGPTSCGQSVIYQLGGSRSSNRIEQSRVLQLVVNGFPVSNLVPFSIYWVDII